MTGAEIRESRAEDTIGIEQLYADAFPDEDLLPLMRQLLAYGPDVLSLVALRDATIAGQVCFTQCRLEEEKGDVALLGPLAVTPELHAQGIGSSLVRTGLHYLQRAKTNCVLVLGDPAYYGRFGFLAEDKITAPYPLPAEWNGAWQSIRRDDAGARLAGRLIVPAPWDHVALWAP